MMFIKVDGVRLEGFISATVKKSLQQLCGEFSFKATSEDVSEFPISRLSSVQIFVDDTQIIDGYVDQIKVQYSADSHTIDINGRDKTLILVDSSIPDNRTFNTPIDIKKIAENIISQLGADIKVKTDLTNLKIFKKEDLNNLVGDHDETAFQFLDRLAKISNVLLTSDFEGNLNIIQNIDPLIIETIIVNNSAENKNDIVSADISYNDVNRFNKYTVYCQKSDLPDIPNLVQAVQKGQTAIDDQALTTKQKIFTLEHAGNIDDCTNRAKWEANIRRAKSIMANYEFNGHYYDKQFLWEIGLIVRVKDIFANINADLLVNSVEYRLSNSEGSSTLLQLIPADSYTLNPSFELGFEKDNILFQLGLA